MCVCIYIYIYIYTHIYYFLVETLQAPAPLRPMAALALRGALLRRAIHYFVIVIMITIMY